MTETRRAQGETTTADGRPGRGAQAGRAAAGGLAAGLTFLLMTGLLIDAEPLNCSEGWDGFGCSIAEGLLAVVVGFGLSVTAGWLTMRLLGARAPFAVAAVGSISAVGVWLLLSDVPGSAAATYATLVLTFVAMFVLHGLLALLDKAVPLLVTLGVAALAVTVFAIF